MWKNKLSLSKVSFILFGAFALTMLILSMIYVVDNSKVWDLWKAKMVQNQNNDNYFSSPTLIYNQMPIKIILLSLLNPWLWIGSIAVLSIFMFLTFVTFKQEAKMLKKVSISILALIFLATILLSASFIVGDWEATLNLGLKDQISNFF